jgi:hypothetical protein
MLRRPYDPETVRERLRQREEYEANKPEAPTYTEVDVEDYEFAYASGVVPVTMEEGSTITKCGEFPREYFHITKGTEEIDIYLEGLLWVRHRVRTMKQLEAKFKPTILDGVDLSGS